MKKERNLYLDVLKAICIILVVVGHCIQYGSGKEYSLGEFFENPIFTCIYSFHMPLFMLISGYLFSCSLKNKTWYEVLYNRFLQLIVPLFAWSVVSLAINMLKASVGVSVNQISIAWIVKNLKSGFLYGPWFLWAVWWCSFVIVIVRRFFGDNLIVYILGCLLTFLLPDAFNSALYKFMWPFFLLAYLFNENDYVSKFKKVYLHKYFIFACFIIFVIMLFFYNYDTYIYTSGYTILNKNVVQQIQINVFRFLIGMVGSLSVLYLTRALMHILPNRITAVLARIGNNTLGIYVISGYIFEEILPRLTSFLTGVNYLYVLIETICVLILSMIINAVLKKYKITNRLFLGGR